jgi:hypothetical protein
MRLDGDDLLNPYALALIFEELNNSETPDVVTSDYFLVNEDNVILEHIIASDPLTLDSYGLNPPNGAVTVWRRDFLRDLGGYRVDLGAQDGTDIWIRSKGRLKVRHISMPIFRYRRHGGNMTIEKSRIVSARRRILGDFVSNNLENKKALALIPCRETFDFIPALWSVKLGAQDLLSLSINALLKVPAVSKIVVAGESELLKAYVEKNYHSEERVMFWQRKRPDTRDSNPLVNLLREVFLSYGAELHPIGLIKYPHAPFVSSDTILEVLNSLAYEDSGSSCLVKEIKSTLLKRNRYGLQILNEIGIVSQNFQSHFEFSRTLLAFRSENLDLFDVWGKSISYVRADFRENWIIQDDLSLRIARMLNE